MLTIQPLQPPRRKQGRVFEHTLHSISETLERSLFAEEISSRPGLLQALDPRVKIISILALLVAVSLSRSLAVIAAVYLLGLLLAWLSAIPADLFIRRVWLALPFFTGIIVLPALFITPGPAFIHLPGGLAVTRTGLISALFMLLRVSTSLSLTLLLILTTRWTALLSALGVLRVPDVFVLILGMTHRYIYLLLRSANELFLARQSRTVGRLSGAENRRMFAAISATLLDRSIKLSGEVYLAMQSRGFRGRIVPLRPFHTRPWDWAYLGLSMAITLLVIYTGR